MQRVCTIFDIARAVSSEIMMVCVRGILRSSCTVSILSLHTECQGGGGEGQGEGQWYWNTAESGCTLKTRYSVLQCAAACCSVLKCSAVWCGVKEEGRKILVGV